MKTVIFEVRVRLPENEEESAAILHSRYRLMDVKGALSITQIGSVDDGKPNPDEVSL